MGGQIWPEIDQDDNENDNDNEIHICIDATNR